MHRGVILAMVTIKEKYWIPNLRQVANREIRSCYECKRFHTKVFTPPQEDQLLKDRTEGSRPFQVIGTDL